MAIVESIMHLLILHLLWKTRILQELLMLSVSLDGMIRLYIYFHNETDGVLFFNSSNMNF